MAKKILKGIGKALFGKKKNKAEGPAAAAAAPTKGQKVTPLGAAGLPLSRRGPPRGAMGSTILGGLSDRLGG